MVIINIGNSYTQIKGLSVEQFKGLRKKLSYQVDAQTAFFSGRTYDRTRYCIDNKGNFATGLLERVEKWLKTNKIEAIGIHAQVSLPPPVNHKPNFKDIEPYPDQTEASNTPYKRGIICMPTGTGKSLVIALLTARHKVRTLIVVPTLEIKTQLTEAFIGLFKDMSNITIENIDSSALKGARNYDMLIIDEAHHVAAKTYQKLNKSVWTGIRYRYMLTATPFRNNTEETLLFEGIAGKVIYNMTYKQAVSKNYIVPIEAYYMELPKVKTDAYTWGEVYSELVVKNKLRNNLIKNLLVLLTAAKKHTLCLVKEIRHGEILSELTGIPFVNGQDEESRKYIKQFSSGKIMAIIGTEGVVGEGVDTKSCEYVIITGLGKAKSALMQKIGRCVRKYKDKESGKVILFQDKSHRFCSRHFKEQCAILESEYGVKAIKLGMKT